MNPLIFSTKPLILLPLNVSEYVDTLASPVGEITIRANDEAITSILFDDPVSVCASNAHTERAKDQLKHYFSRSLERFDLILSPEGTDFQKKVWRLLREIPYGRTVSYKELSINLGDLKAIRAVGTANGANPIAIVIPCHRVIGSNGELVGYAGGLERKKKLLELESPFIQKTLF